MVTALINANVFTGERWFSDQAVLIAGDRIVDLVPASAVPADAKKFDLKGLKLIPGLIDTQVNGGGGVLFNDAPTVETLRTMGEAHRKFGTTGFYPTLISDDLDVVKKAIAAVNDAIDQQVPGVLGIHLEGPFLSPERKGVHNPEKFRIIDDAAIDLLTSLSNGKTLVTLAPERTTPERIRQLADAGVVIAAGHSAADYEQTKAALDAGVTSFTHLFNAMTPLTGREPGMVGAALADKKSWCGIIVDNFHVHPTTLKVACDAKANGKMVLVTDAMSSVGATNKNFMLNGEEVFWTDGKLTTANGTLAGSDLTMLDAVKNTVELVGLCIDEAIRMASIYPARMMGTDHELGLIKPGFKASLIAIDDNYKLACGWINGEEYR